MSFADLWESLLPIGRAAPAGGYRRYTFSAADAQCRDWFRQAATDRGLRLDPDRNGNLWAWWDLAPGTEPDRAGGGAIVTGSHLDSVPDGGAFDGPLGVASAFAAIDLLRANGVRPCRPIAVVSFAEEEGARFGVACLGSRLLSGAITPEAARALTDADGVPLTSAMAEAGLDPAAIGPDPDRLTAISAFVELHVEQGSALAGLGSAVGVASSIWPHGRWRLDFAGRADHAGTTTLVDRRDPMLPFATTVLAARHEAARRGALATVSKVIPVPGGVNGICARVSAWLDARAPDETTLTDLTSAIEVAARSSGDEHKVTVTITRESCSPTVGFDPALRHRIVAALAGRRIIAPALPTGAGHDAGVLAARIPTAMLFVRNQTGVSHSPAEHAELADCEAGVAALAAVLGDLACP